MHALGRILNVVQTASAVAIPLTQATAVSFVHAQPGTGTATLTLTQVKADGSGSKALDAADRGYHVGPDVGGTWTAKAATSAAVYTLGGASDDTGVLTVHVAELDQANGFTSVVATASAGTCVAIVHDLLVQRKPANLKSSIVA